MRAFTISFLLLVACDDGAADRCGDVNRSPGVLCCASVQPPADYPSGACQGSATCSDFRFEGTYCTCENGAWLCHPHCPGGPCRGDLSMPLEPRDLSSRD